MGSARSVKTKEWNYIALRYTQEQVEAIRRNHRSVKQLMGLSGGVSRARMQPDAFDPDQLYDLNADPEEMINVADDRKNRKQLRKMQRYLKQELGRFVQRPFGEFIPGRQCGARRRANRSAALAQKNRRRNEVSEVAASGWLNS